MNIDMNCDLPLLLKDNASLCDDGNYPNLPLLNYEETSIRNIFTFFFHVLPHGHLSQWAAGTHTGVPQIKVVHHPITSFMLLR